MSQLGASIFFVSYLLIVSIVLINLVVAVLLDKMVAPEEVGVRLVVLNTHNAPIPRRTATRRLLRCIHPHLTLR